MECLQIPPALNPQSGKQPSKQELLECEFELGAAQALAGPIQTSHP